ncbi:MAG: hypothetical protein LC798_19705 [Chloroflexi bacterium]|nr:hypothetical protein [Chloroflexota bacterium]
MSEPAGVEDVVAVYGTRYHLWLPMHLAVCNDCSALIQDHPEAITNHYRWHAQFDGDEGKAESIHHHGNDGSSSPSGEGCVATGFHLPARVRREQ